MGKIVIVWLLGHLLFFRPLAQVFTHSFREIRDNYCQKVFLSDADEEKIMTFCCIVIQKFKQGKELS
jgi:hypothetical protein